MDATKLNKKKATLKKAGMLDTIYEYKPIKKSLKELQNEYMTYVFLGQPFPINDSPDVKYQIKMLNDQMLNIDICLDKEKGSLLHLPYRGSIEEQPCIRFEYFLLLRQQWIKQISNMREKNGQRITTGVK